MLSSKVGGVILSSNDESESFNADATWYLRPGLVDESAISLESYALPGHFIGKRFGITALIEEASMKNDLERKNATFQLGGQ